MSKTHEVTLRQLSRQFMTPQRRRALDAALATGRVVEATGLAGSSAAVMIASLKVKSEERRAERGSHITQLQLKGDNAIEGGRAKARPCKGDVGPNAPVENGTNDPALFTLHPSLFTLVIIGDDADDAGYLYHDLTHILGEENVVMFPSGYRRDIRYGQPDPPSVILRTEVMQRIAERDSVKCEEWSVERRSHSTGDEAEPLHPSPFTLHTQNTLYIVTYPEALAEQVTAPETLQLNSLPLVKGREYDMGQTLTWLREHGFREEDFVYEPGTFATRGSLIDIFGYSREWPVRLDFFGDELDSIRTFDTDTQLSREQLDEVIITPDLGRTSPARGASLLRQLPDTAWVVARDPQHLIARVRAIADEKMSASALHTEDLDVNALDRVVDPAELEASLRRLLRLTFSGKVESGKLNVESSSLITPSDASDMSDVSDKAPHHTAGNEVEPLHSSPFTLHSQSTVNFHCRPQGIYHKNFDLIADTFGRLLAQGDTIYILSDSPKQTHRLRDIFDSRGDNIPFTPVTPTLHEGFVDETLGRCIFTDHQIFDRFHRYSLKAQNVRNGRTALSLKELNSIQPGDYIVHQDHGVGRFGGLVRTATNGAPQEMIKLLYAGDDMVMVSIHSLHKLSKYRGKDAVPPQVNRLGSRAWATLKSRAKSRLKDIARDLIQLYASRARAEGHAFAADTYMQHELEASFIYEDTPDQLAATQAVKADMEAPRPMDRLICGDVGFGKTEVAIRAAFKAAADGRQTAVMVPTTVLAWQHYDTFRQRLKDMPVTVEYLSRARSPKQVKDILQRLSEGKIDILIGTHKLIGKNVKWHDLGLLIIDEEQKFGVAVKERLRQMRTSVDTLTMSATPIPRTLQFSLLGARDLSAINTPPPNRHPIVTTVAPLSDDVVAEAVNFELSRGGQVFVINNRIEGLDRLEAMLKRLAPGARIVKAHGQMPPAQLEDAVLSFAAHEYDILLATTIVESGIDMPNVNTILINNAQQFGLSELHQLRGRVGRSSRKAFAYMLVPEGAPLSPVARRRLQAIESFADLGSGMQIAMQDLDIRGAGDLLGAEQSGFITDLGYETYQRILHEAVIEVRNESEEWKVESGEAEGNETPAEWVADTVVESDLEVLLPGYYVPQEAERIALYRELDSLDTERDLEAFEQRLRDRFGPLPAPAQDLMMVPRVRRLARQLGIEKVALRQGNMYMYFVGEDNAAYYHSPMFGKLLKYATMRTRQVQLRQANDRRSMVRQGIHTFADAHKVLSLVYSL